LSPGVGLSSDSHIVGKAPQRRYAEDALSA
jgi:hypothetical protein